VAALAAPETPAAERGVELGLHLLTVVITGASLGLGADVVPAALLVVPLLIGGLALRPAALRRLSALMAVALVVLVSVQGVDGVRVGVVVAVVIVGLVANELARSKETLGLSSTRRESMLLELRDRLQTQGALPPLSAPWHAEVEQRWAGSGSFGGDFIVSAMTAPDRLELALVDVSGKGVDAGTRALMLSGALGGLLGAVPPERFLHAANDYLIRQDWGEGFATAVHLTVDLRTGRFRVINAGHPPPVHYRGGAGRWRLMELHGTVLGVTGDPEFGDEAGELRPYDALLLYTDGIVEVPGRELAVGIDRLVGEAERLIPRGFDGGAERLVDSVAPHALDDRALVLFWRT
jgi:serine phosphatase RsbU (regulator of sigma subunit)